MSRKSTRLLVLMPVGPRTPWEYLTDTLASVTHYTRQPRKIVVVDDSGEDVGRALAAEYPEIDVVRTPGKQGLGAGLYITLSQGLRHALSKYEFSVVLKLDVDALVTGAAPELEAEEFFRANPRVGIIGSYKFDCLGQPRENTRPQAVLARETRLGSAWRDWLRPRGNGRKTLRRALLLRRLLKAARKHDYETGEHCLGGAYFMNGELVRRLGEQNLLQREELRTSQLEEDHLFGLLCRTVGMELGDFATGTQPMGLRWRGLPCSPADLVARGKKVIHSTNFWHEIKEPEIREYFRKRRQSDAPVTADAASALPAVSDVR